MNETACPYDVFLNHSAKDKAGVRPLAERLRQLGVAAPRQSAANVPADRACDEGVDGGARPRRRYAEQFAFDFRNSDFGFAQPGPFRFRDPLNQDRRFIPLRLGNAPIQGSLAPCRCKDSRGSEFCLCSVPTLRHSSRRDVRTVARRMEGVARPDSVGAFSAQRGTVRAIPGDGRQP